MPFSTAVAQIPRVPLWRLVRDKVVRDYMAVRAAALAFSTILSLVPVFAVILAVLAGPAFQTQRERVLDKMASALVPDESNGWVIDANSPQEKFKETFRETIVPLAERMGTVGIFGFLILLATAGMLFRNIERAFNTIWRCGSNRPFFLRVAIATSMLFWGPVMLAFSISLTELLNSWHVLFGYIAPILFSTLMFTALFMLMPHARVRFRAALIGGLLTSLCWEVTKIFFLVYVTRVVSYNKIYGSLGLVPMLLLWVYLNWLLILMGAELAYGLQHRGALAEQWLALLREKEGTDAEKERPSPTAVLAVAIEAARSFRSGATGGLRLSQLTEALYAEPVLVRQAAERLVKRKILVRVNEENSSEIKEEDPVFLPACDPRQCDVSTLLLAACGDRDTEGRGPAWERAQKLLTTAAAMSDPGLSKLKLADLAEPVSGPEKNV
jgi:membrane protein